MSVSACLVTRGDHDLTPILDSITASGSVDEVLIWDNSKREDLSVYGRYALIAEAKHPLIFVTDDDVLLPPDSIREIIWQSDSGGNAYGQLVCNMPQEFRHDFYIDHALVGFGACFHRDLPKMAFGAFNHFHWTMDESAPETLSPHSDFFYRTCDIVFTALTPHVLVDVPYSNLPWATAEDRLYRQPEHVGERKRMLELALKVRNS